MSNVHKKAAIARRMAEKIASEWDRLMPVGEFYSEKYVPESIGLKLTPCKPKKFRRVKRLKLTEDYIMTCYRFDTQILWLYHPGVKSGDIHKYEMVSHKMIKKANIKKLMEKESV